MFQHYYENFLRNVAVKLPKRWIYFATIQLIAEVTSGEYSQTLVANLSAMDAVGRFEKKHKLNPATRG